MSTKIIYNSKTTEIADGNIATLTCSGKKMATDVVIAVPEAEVIPEYTEVEDFAVFVNGLEGEVEISYDVSQKVALPAGSPARLTSVSDANFIANNIKSGVSIFGLTGAYEAETVEEWDGTGVVIEEIENLITFTIGGTSYQAESGMTWAEWVQSEYNTDGVTINGKQPYKNGYIHTASGTAQFSTDVIVANEAYVALLSGGS